MTGSVNLLDTMSALARHAAKRHAVIADNIANADTPGYKAQDLKPFSEVFSQSVREGKNIKQMGSDMTAMPTSDIASPNGNNVSLEQQMMLSAQNKADHDMALAVYKKTLDMMKMAIGKNL